MDVRMNGVIKMTPRRDLLKPYTAQKWMISNFTQIPKFTINLGLKNTPLEPWHLSDLPGNVDLFIKRDDLTGFSLSGTKVRKGELLLAKAVEEDVQHVICTGRPGSNFCRIIANGCRKVGLTPHVLLRGNENDVKMNGNDVIIRQMKPDLRYREITGEENINRELEKMKTDIERETGGKAAILRCIESEPSSVLGIFGQMDLFAEIVKQKSDITDIFLASYSGETAIALAMAKHYTNSNVRIHAISTSSKNFILERLHCVLQMLGKRDELYETIKSQFTIYEGFEQCVDNDEYLISEISVGTGVLLDKEYTIKAFQGMREILRLENEPGMRKTVLFLHTGGIFANF